MTNVNSDNSAESTPTDAPTDASSGASTGAAAGGASGLPLRGLAMVLIAVAVMLGMWGLYKLTSEDSSDTASQTGASEAATLPAPAEGELGAQGGKPGSAAQQAPGESAQASDPAAAGEKRDNAGEGENAADRDGHDGAQGEAAKRAPKDIPVNVFNNSGRAGYADEESTKLKDRGFKVGEVGNLPGDVLTVPQTMVFYPAGDKDAEALARQTAAEFYGATAVPEGAVAEYPAELGENYTKGNAVVAVLAIPQA
ncbi:LytR C-terminal domain-containing protein [Corynebacterium striatum]|uniref:LytR C-terminal domain-containing protein n=1 Tax=Corynebacterium striatum TaxID=43770 RepID=UPI000667E866|nr:LytR C-terminal domain-containing protein [Corynebacterium striatum]KAA1271798.1 LytR family transcriptional regulator [Corynebacterium striatum]HEI8411314.1 LytR C-terminal domain-containing protein [Corynebacterium striatum]